MRAMDLEQLGKNSKVLGAANVLRLLYNDVEVNICLQRL
jgi:hypothetical protein